MKRKIGLALAMGLALLIAGCASQSGGSSSGGGGSAPPAAAASTSRNFNLAVKCPGVHWEKTHGWTDQQIMDQESLDSQDIPACEQWVQAQPKGYVPPPPGGPMAAKAPSGAPSPAAQ
ncbi:MAG: hypothetical protein ABSD30_09445 [Candidatus Binatus sp.]|jgi:hypothetical protein